MKRAAFAIALALSMAAMAQAQAEDIADICPATGGAATLTNYQDFAVTAFLASEWAAGWDATAAFTPGSLTLPASDTTDGVSLEGTFAETSGGHVLHMTTFSDVTGNALLRPYRITVLRTPEVQAVLALTSCGDVFFQTWTHPSNLPLFDWPAG